MDRVLGGGLVPGSAILIGGNPGAGKSTLLLQIMCLLANSGKPALYVTGEESLQQVGMRAKRLNLPEKNLKMLAETNVEQICKAAQEHQPQLLVVDSIQVMHSGLDLENAWKRISQIDDLIEDHVTFAFHERLGYLTACPTNVGTGMRVSVMLHLPAMVQMKQIEKLFNAAHRTGLTVRGFYGEGTMASGDLYQISNQVTLATM